MKKLILFLALLLPIHAAISASSVWEVQQAGSNNNGCFFVTGATGMDYSQNGATTHATITTLSVVNATTTKLTVSLTDYTVSANDVGNGFHDTGGTLTQGWYEITGVDTMLNTWTVDRSLGTAAQTGTGKMGGSCGTPAFGSTTTPAVGNVIYMKADATYSIAAQWALNNANNISFIGYTSSRTDGGSPTVQASAGSFLMIRFTGGTGVQFKNLIVDCNSQTGSQGMGGSTGSRVVSNLVVKNCKGTALLLNSGGAGGFICENCVVTAQSSGVSIDLSNGTCMDCGVSTPGSGTSHAFQFSTASGICIRCIGEGHASATTADVFNFASTGMPALLDGGTCYNAGRDCYRLACTSACLPIQIYNSICWTAVGYCFNVSGGGGQLYILADYNGVGVNGGTGARNNLTAGAHDVTLTADPFTNSGAHNFGLNSTAGGGAALKGVGYQLPMPLP